MSDFDAAAREMAEAFAQRYRLDYSKQSLEQVQAALTADSALGAGAYLAEVVRRRSPVTLRWVPASVLPGPADVDNPFLLATPKNVVFAVLGKPKKLLDGDADTLTRFADAVQDVCSREATSLG